ncbi:MAG: TerB family tellurite resistance protein [Magnetovibrionaceae bacterium]
MFEHLKRLFSGEGFSSSTSEGDGEGPQLAAAALLVEAGLMDGTLDADEERTILALLQDHFSLSLEEANSILAAAKEKVDHSVELYSFAKQVKEGYPPERRVEVIEMLWEVVYADGVVHDYEANLVRRVAGLIYVSDRDSGDARKRVTARLGIT